MDPCTTATPCRLDHAMGVSVSRDDVSLLPGDYYDPADKPWSELPRMPAYTSIHGTVGRPVPVIHGHRTEVGGFLKLDGATASDLALDVDTGGEFLTISGLLLINNASAERVQVHVSNGGHDGSISACQMQNTVKLLDSVCFLDGRHSYGSALSMNSYYDEANTPGYARNVTAVSSSPEGVGIRFDTSTKTIVLNATNVIARGRAYDVAMYAPYGPGTVRLMADHSNFGPTLSTGFGKREIVQDPGNQAGATAATPLFVNEAAGDLRQAPGSPTIDAGATGGISLFDFAGDPRIVGSATDIGADEFVPSAPATSGGTGTIGERVGNQSPSTKGGGGPGSTPVRGVDPDAATISAVRIGRRWRLASRTAKATHKKKTPVGTTIDFTLSKDATATLEFSRLRTGRRVGRACRPPKRADRRKPKCTIADVRGALTVKARAGRNTMRFEGRLPSGTDLRPGAYRLTVRAGTGSIPRQATFTIVG